jgi:hypothetical protein
MRRRFRWNDAPVGRVRAYDANVGAPGEYPPASGGTEETPFDQGRRRVPLSGRDQAIG